MVQWRDDRAKRWRAPRVAARLLARHVDFVALKTMAPILSYIPGVLLAPLVHVMVLVAPPSQGMVGLG